MEGLGHQVLRIQVTHALDAHAGNFDISKIIERIIKNHGFVDIDEISAEARYDLFMSALDTDWERALLLNWAVEEGIKEG